MTHLSLKAKSNKTDANEVSYEASYEAPLTTKTRLKPNPELDCSIAYFRN